MIKFVWVGLIVGGMLGQFIPELWGASAFSITAGVFSFVFGALGLWLGFKIDRSIG